MTPPKESLMETARPVPTTTPNNDVTDGKTAAPTPLKEAPGKAAAKPRGRRPFVILGVIAAVAGLVIGGYSLMTAGRESTDDAQVAADVVPVSARVGGVVLKTAIHDNQTVKKGVLLIELDGADARARVQQAEAELATAQAQSAGADAQVTIVDATSKGGLVSARADAEMHKAEIDL